MEIGLFNVLGTRGWMDFRFLVENRGACKRSSHLGQILGEGIVKWIGEYVVQFETAGNVVQGSACGSDEHGWVWNHHVFN